MFYRQCLLTCGSLRTTGWIDESCARLGAKVKIEDDDRIWLVEAVWSRKHKDIIKEHERDYDKHRKFSDI